MLSSFPLVEDETMLLFGEIIEFIGFDLGSDSVVLAMETPCALLLVTICLRHHITCSCKDKSIFVK
jgi:hypothetical protein